jgi:hypothetical protein
MRTDIAAALTRLVAVLVAIGTAGPRHSASAGQVLAARGTVTVIVAR